MPTSTLVRNWIACSALVLSVAAPLAERTTVAPPTVALAAAVDAPSEPTTPPLVAAGGSGLRAREVAGTHQAGLFKALTTARSVKDRKPADKAGSISVGRERTGSRAVSSDRGVEGAGSAAVKAVDFALDKLGLPYEWGGAGPDSYDCSGLTMRAYEAAGIALPRTAAQQAQVGEPVAVDDLLPGDLLFYATDPSDLNTVHHVVMYLGDGQIVHAPHTGDVVRVGPMWLGDEYAGAVRLVPGERGAGVADVLAALARRARAAEAKAVPSASRKPVVRRPAASPEPASRPSEPRPSPDPPSPTGSPQAGPSASLPGAPTSPAPTAPVATAPSPAAPSGPASAPPSTGPVTAPTPSATPSVTPAPTASPTVGPPASATPSASPSPSDVGDCPVTTRLLPVDC